MNKTLFIVALIMLSFTSFSQNLNSKTDPFTKATILSTSQETLYDVLLSSMNFYIRKVDNTYILGFFKINGTMYSVSESEKGIILCKSGKTYDIIPRAFQQWEGYGNLQSYIHEYYAKEDDLKKMIDDEPIGIRFYAVSGGYDEFGIKERRRSVIPNHIKVILGLKEPSNKEEVKDNTY